MSSGRSQSGNNMRFDRTANLTEEVIQLMSTRLDVATVKSSETLSMNTMYSHVRII